MKTEIFPLGTEYCFTTLQVKTWLEIALSLTISKIFSMFYFPLNPRWPPKLGKNFSPRYRILFYYPVGQNFARNRSISYHFEDIFNVLFSAKSKMAAKIGKKFSRFHRILLCVKKSLEIALSLTVFEIFTLFHFPLKSKMAAKSGEN